MIAELLSIVTPIFIAVAAGFAWAKLDRPYDADLVTSLVYYVGTPCLVFSILANVELDPGAVGIMAGASIAALFTTGAVGYIVLKVFKQPIRAFLPSMIFSNSGNMGLPLCLLAFGENGLAFGITYFTVSSVFNHTVGSGIAAGVTTVRHVLRVPMIYAAALAFVCLWTGIRPPEWINNTTDLLGGMSIPLLLITLGISLARLNVGGLKRAVLLSLLRFALGFAVGLGISEVLGLDGIARGVLILQSSLPVAVFNFLFAKRFDASPDEVAGLVVVSTTMAFVLLPALMWFVLRQSAL